jgi:hypothetical protein
MKALLQTVPGAMVERKSVLPEKVPGGGLIILRDGYPGEPEQALGGFAKPTTSMQSRSRSTSKKVTERSGTPPTSFQEIGAVLEANAALVASPPIRFT